MIMTIIVVVLVMIMIMMMMMFEDADYVDSGCVGDGDDNDMMIDNDD